MIYFSSSQTSSAPLFVVLVANSNSLVIVIHVHTTLKVDSKGGAFGRCHSVAECALAHIDITITRWMCFEWLYGHIEGSESCHVLLLLIVTAMSLAHTVLKSDKFIMEHEYDFRTRRYTRR